MNPPAIQGVSTEFKQAHDAGFDAYMTGDVFIKLAYQYRLDVKGLVFKRLFSRTSKLAGLLHHPFTFNNFT